MGAPIIDACGRREQRFSPGNAPIAAFLVAVALTLVLLAVSGCQNQANTLRGAVSGVVLDVGGNRVVGALVKSHRSLYEATTGADGRYAFTSLDDGSHNLTVSHSGFKTATQTIVIDAGADVAAVDFRLEPLPARITWEVVARSRQSVTVFATTAEPMSCQIRYQGTNVAPIATPWESGRDTEHRFDIEGLLPETLYSFTVEGIAVDGQHYLSSAGTFFPASTNVSVDGPTVPTTLAVTQDFAGAHLSWVYPASDSLAGFRLFRAEQDQPLTPWQDERIVFATDRTAFDPDIAPGVRCRYAVAAVYRDGRISSRSAEIALIPVGRLVRDVTWKTAWSPIDLRGQLQVPAGRTLTIEPGVLVRVSAGAISPTDATPIPGALFVDGTLAARGTVAAPIRFLSTSSQPGRNDWLGIELRTDPSANAGDLAHLEVAGAQVGLLVHDCVGTLASLTFNTCGIGLHLMQTTNATVSGVIARDCTTGIRFSNTVDCRLSAIVVNSAEVGIDCNSNRNLRLSEFDVRETRRQALLIADVTAPVVRNGVGAGSYQALKLGGIGGDLRFITFDAPEGVLVDNTATAPVLRNLIIVNRDHPGRGYGLTDNRPGRSYPYTNIVGFFAACQGCDQMGAGVQNVDPAFVGGQPFDYHLASASSLLNAAEGGGQLGAYGP